MDASRPGVRAVGALALAGVAVAGLFVSIYALKGYRQPLGFDTARYLWRNACVAEGGIQGLRACAPPLATAQAGRVAYPLVTLPLQGALGPVAEGVPSGFTGVLAAAIGLAAAGLAGVTTRRGVRSLAVIAVVVGTSPMVVRMGAPEGYADAMLATALALGAFAAAAVWVLDGRGGIAAAALLALAGLAHWATFGIFVAVLGVTMLVLVPSSWRAWRGGLRLLATPAARLGMVLAGAGIGWAAGAYGLVRHGPDRFAADVASLREKVASDMAAYLLPVTLPAAGAGAFELGRRRSPRTAFLESLAVGWFAVIALAVALWLVSPSLPRFLNRFGPGFPLHRFLVVGLVVPLLASFAVLWLGAAARRFGRAASAAIVAVAVVGLAAIGFRLWMRNVPYLDGTRVAEGAAAGAYLDRQVAPGTPVVVVVDGVTGNPFIALYQVADNVRIGLGAGRVRHTYLYLGATEALLLRAPTLVGDPGYDAASSHRFRPLGRILDRPHVALVLRSLSPEYERLAAAMPERLAAPGVLVMTGPEPEERGPTPARDDVAFPEAAAAALGMLLLLGVAGGGWAVALLRPGARPMDAAALAPAFGIGALVLAGLAADAVGIRPHGASGVGILVVASAAGWVLAARSRS